MSEQMFRVQTHKLSQWKWNVHEWLSSQIKHGWMADKVDPCSIVSVFEQIGNQT